VGRLDASPLTCVSLQPFYAGGRIEADSARMAAYVQQAAAEGWPVEERVVPWCEIAAHLAAGHLAIVLIDQHTLKYPVCMYVCVLVYVCACLLMMPWLYETHPRGDADIPST
jgi:hypothetical protein